jgi:hypothetical protein
MVDAEHVIVSDLSIHQDIGFSILHLYMRIPGDADQRSGLMPIT